MKTETDKAKAMLDGMSKDIPAGTQSLLVNGQALAVKQIVATLTAYLALATANAAAKVQAHQAVQALHQQTPQIRAFIVDLAAALRGLLGKGNPVLANFGIAVRTRKATPAKVKAAAAAKAKATRDAKRPQAPAPQAGPAEPGVPANGK